MGSPRQRCGCSSSGRSVPIRGTDTIPATLRSVPRYACSCGSVACDGPLNNVLKKGKRNSEWRTMKCGNMEAGSTTCCSRCSHIFSLVLEGAFGGQKHQHSRCHSSAGYSKSCCPCIRIRSRRASPSWLGPNGAITRHIAHIVSAERQRAKKVAL